MHSILPVLETLVVALKTARLRKRSLWQGVQSCIHVSRASLTSSTDVRLGPAAPTTMTLSSRQRCSLSVTTSGACWTARTPCISSRQPPQTSAGNVASRKLLLRYASASLAFWTSLRAMEFSMLCLGLGDAVSSEMTRPPLPPSSTSTSQGHSVAGFVALCSLSWMGGWQTCSRRCSAQPFYRPPRRDPSEVLRKNGAVA